MRQEEHDKVLSLRQPRQSPLLGHAAETGSKDDMRGSCSPINVSASL